MQRLIYFCHSDQALAQPIEKALTLFFVSDLPAFENHRCFHFVPICDELQRMLCLELEIMNVRVRVKSEFLHQAYVLVFLLYLLFFLKFVLVLPKVHHFADRRLGIWYDFNEISSLLLSKGQRFFRGHYAQLLTVVIDNADLYRAYLVVDAGAFTFDAVISYAVMDFC